MLSLCKQPFKRTVCQVLSQPPYLVILSESPVKCLQKAFSHIVPSKDNLHFSTQGSKWILITLNCIFIYSRFNQKKNVICSPAGEILIRVFQVNYQYSKLLFIHSMVKMLRFVKWKIFNQVLSGVYNGI